MLVGLAMGLGVFININTSKNVEPVNAATNLVTYYSNVNGSGSALLSSIANVVGYDSTSANNKITDIGYDGLKTAYTKTDVRSDGKIRDIYSDNTSYTPGSNFASSYNSVGDGYNREHVIPKSWWGHSGSSNPTKQGSDLFIVLPSDAKANGMRSNFPYGLTNSTTMYKMANDPVGNKLGTSSNTSYVSGTVFEPFEDRKGDIARIYFYAAAAYKKGGANNGAVTTWTDGDGSKVFSSSGNNGFVQNYLNLLLKWHKDDPVSQFEIDRNENVQTKTNQGNRNPFVDHPSWVDLIWGGTYSGTNSEDTSSGTVVNGQLSPSSSPYLTSISVQTAPNKTTYTAGEYFDPTGLVINRIYSDTSLNDTFTYANHTSEFSFTPSTSTALTTSNKSVSITYGGKTTSQTITVTSSGGSGGSSQDVIDNSATSSYLGGTATSSWATDFSISGSSGASYTIHSMGTTGTSNGLQWNSNGFLYSTVSGGTITGVSAIMTSGKSVEVFGSNSAFSGNSGGTSIGTISGTNSLSTNAGYTFIRIKGSSSGNAITSITIEYGSASQKTLSSISVKTAPTKTSYNVGQYFDPTGLVIRRNYSDNTNDTYSYADHTSEFSFSPSTSTALTVSNTSVTISYGGKTCTQTITVTAVAKTLSSISVSGQKTSFTVGDSFTFGGTVTATFSDSTTSNVTSSASFSGYNMNSAGNQTVTVSYTYSGVTKTTSYSISVTSYRTVIEEGYSTIGTINYTNDEEEISVNTLSTSISGGYSAIDTQYHAWRLGSGNKTGTLTVNSTSNNIRKIVVNAKYYNNDSETTFSIGGTNFTLTNSYADYTKEYSTATNSVAISSIASGKRVLIATITVYSYLSQNIGNTADCLGLESFIENYLHMDYTQNLGYCKDNTHHYYSTAKSAFNNLNTHQRSLFVGNSAYASEFARLSAWASANGESFNSNNQLSQRVNLLNSPIILEKNNSIIVLVILTLVGVTAIGVHIYISKRKSSR